MLIIAETAMFLETEVAASESKDMGNKYLQVPSYHLVSQ
jgi:hypothetical protein